METRIRRVTREDVLMFVNASFACTGQREFYLDGQGHSVSIGFLHQYILGNYRRLYARTLACGINEFNRALIVANLLSSGSDTEAKDRKEENALVTRSVVALPTSRAMCLFEELRRRRINNRRTRALVRRYLEGPSARDGRAAAYRTSFRSAAIHAHVPFSGELASVFSRGASGSRGSERHPPAAASFEGFQQVGCGETSKLSPTRLAHHVLALSLEERRARGVELGATLDAVARRAVRRAGVRFGKVACVLDRSFSMRGTTDEEQRPLALALAASRVLRAAAGELAVFWTAETSDELLVTPRGTTDLVTPILAALRTEPELVVVVSDGVDNGHPPRVLGEILELAQKLTPRSFIVHLNPVVDADVLAPRALSRRVPTIGLRFAEDIPTLVAFARFALGKAPPAELDEHLERRVRAFLKETA